MLATLQLPMKYSENGYHENPVSRNYSVNTVTRVKPFLTAHMAANVAFARLLLNTFFLELGYNINNVKLTYKFQVVKNNKK